MQISRFALALASALIPTMLPFAVHAQEAPDEGESRPAIIVVGKGQADVAEEQIKRTPGGVDVVPYADYADRTVVSLRDTLAFSPGVYTQPRFGQEVRISIRGSGLSRSFHMRGLTLLQDGVPINLSDDNGDFQELEPIFLDHLEVYRGGNALRFGSGTLGGAINGVTPHGDTAHGIFARIDGGSYNMIRGLVSGGFGDERLNAWAGISADSHDGDRDHAKRHALRFNGNLGVKLADGLTTRFYASVNDIHQQLPGALTRSDALSTPEKGNTFGDQARDITSVRVQNRTTLDLGSATIEAGAFYNHKELFHPIYVVIDQQSDDKGAFVRSEWRSDLVSATLGGEIRWGTTTAKQFVNVNGHRGSQIFEARQRARTANLYGEVRVTPTAGLALIGGGIWADGWREQDRSAPTAVKGRAAFQAFSPKLGVLWQPVAGVEVYANYNRSVEFPTFVELAQKADFVPVKPQKAWTAEAGTRGHLGQVSWDVTYYRATLKGEMLQYTVSTDIPASTFNANRTLHQGVEAGLSWQATDWLRLREVWQWSDFRFRGDAVYGDNRLPVVPAHVVRSELRFGSEALHVSPNVEWVPQGGFADYANTTRTPGYVLVGLSAGATVRDGLDLFLDVRNLADRKAIGDVAAVITAMPASAIYYPVERRAVYAGLRARF